MNTERNRKMVANLAAALELLTDATTMARENPEHVQQLILRATNRLRLLSLDIITEGQER